MPIGDGRGVRLQKLLSSRGVASRRVAEEMIARGEVTVNGVTAQVGQSVQEDSDVIRVNGVVLREQVEKRYLALNKPTGYVTTMWDRHHVRTVVDLLPSLPRVYPVGRLDRDTSGLLLLTNDGDWAEGILHPRFGVPKEYRAVVRGKPSEEAIALLQGGVELPDGARTSPAHVALRRVSRGNSELDVTVIEGRKRQIRLMCAAVGHPVIALRRVRVGSVELGNLREGTWRELSHSEVEGLRLPKWGPASEGPDLRHRRNRWSGRRR